jgi:hypothetical protein
MLLLLGGTARTDSEVTACSGKQHKLKSTVTLAAEIGCGAE